MTTIKWDKINEKLPTEKGGPAKTKRGELWKKFNVNGNPYLSLAEVDKGLLGMDLPVISNNKEVVMRAFQASKGAHNAPGDENDIGEDYIERSEFRLLFVYLKSYLELWNLFDDIDTGDDKKINQEEFESALPTMDAWGITLKDPQASFQEADADGGGQILFDEFAHWAIQKALHVQINLGPTSPAPKKKITIGGAAKRGSKSRNSLTKKKLTSLDWRKLNSRLPSAKTEDEKTKRKRLWNSFNVNGNPYLSLAEVDKGCREVLKLPEIANNKMVIMRAFQAAKGVHNASGEKDIGENYIERSEFRLLFVYLKGYLELWRIFDEIDSSKDKKINREEFQSAVPTLKKWGIPMENVGETFDEVDANGGGEILFDEFADWSIRKSLAVEFEVDMTPIKAKKAPSTPTNQVESKPGEDDGEAKASSFDWEKVKEKLPAEKTEEQTAQRKELFDQFDPNGNGYLSLAEVQKGCEDVIVVPEIYENKPVMMRAFQAAKGVSNSSGGSDVGEDYIERSEFRLLLLYLRNYLEIWNIFDEIDTGDDRRINLEEFQSAVPTMEGWGIEIEDAEASFAEIDANGGGQVLFDEFADWSIKKSLIVDFEVPEPAPTKAADDDDSFAASLDDILSDDSDMGLDDQADPESLDWETIKEKLPAEKTEEQTAQRKELFDKFDPNGNGYLSLAEVQKGCEEVIAVPEIYENKPVMMRAFQAAKGVSNNSSSDIGEDYIERSEFRLLLLYLRNYLEIWQIFDKIDTGDDHRVNLDEFRSAIPILEGWGVPIDDAETRFAEIDTNGGGEILFQEFSDWSIKKAMHVEIGPEAATPSVDEESEENEGAANSGENEADKPSLDWEKIREKLPTEKTEEQKALRKALFDGFDPNGNGYLSLAEVQRGCEQVIGLPEIYENKPVMMRAYQAARNVANKKTPSGDAEEGGDSEDVGEHYIERSEFRLFLVYLRNYLEVWQMFDRIDTGDDRRIDLEEFESALPLLKRWGVEIDDAESSFSEIDANGGGQILFDEFSHWAIQKGLDLEDDDE